MPDGIVIGLLGKLPAHGDFIRRGGPPSVLRAVDDWLDRELAAASTRDPAAFEAERDLPEWRFAVGVQDMRIVGTMMGSCDSVGRSFPVLAMATGADWDADAADSWCGEAAAVLQRAQAEHIPADAAYALLAALDAAPVGGGAPAGGWWQPGGDAAGPEALPTGAAFDQLLARAPA